MTWPSFSLMPNYQFVIESYLKAKSLGEKVLV